MKFQSKGFIVLFLLLVSSVIGGLVVVQADCSTNTPADGSTVTCTSGDDDPGDANDAQETDTVGTGPEDNVTVNVDGTGDIQTAGDGIFIDENATVNNNGNINQNVEDGVDIFTGTVNNNATGNINQNGDDGVDIDDSGTVNNAGNINGNGESGIDSDWDATVNNSGNINNNGGNGVDIYNYGTVNNSATGNINQNDELGVIIWDGTVNNAGSINENLVGVVIENQGSVTNSGHVDQNDEGGIFVFEGNVTNTGSVDQNGGTGIDVYIVGTVNNSGSVNQNASDGVAIGMGVIINTGDIQDNGDHGIHVYENGVVVNDGTISGNDAGGANVQILFENASCGCGGSGEDVFIQGQNGRVIGVNGQVAIQMGDDDDVVYIDIRSEVVGIIDGSTHNAGDRLVFTISSSDAVEVAEFTQFMLGVSILDNTLTYKGRTFNWINFEELASIIYDLAVAEGIQEVPQGDGGGAEGFCANTEVATFRRQNRDLEVFSGFTLLPPGGFLVGVIEMNALQNGTRRFSDAGGLNPGWYVEASPTGNVGRWRATVYDDNGNPIGACDFLFTLRENER